MEKLIVRPGRLTRAGGRGHVSYREVSEGAALRTPQAADAPALPAVVTPPASPRTLLGLVSLADLRAWGDPALLAQEVEDRGTRG